MNYFYIYVYMTCLSLNASDFRTLIFNQLKERNTYVECIANRENIAQQLRNRDADVKKIHEIYTNNMNTIIANKEEDALDEWEHIAEKHDCYYPVEKSCVKKFIKKTAKYIAMGSISATTVLLLFKNGNIDSIRDIGFIEGVISASIPAVSLSQRDALNLFEKTVAMTLQGMPYRFEKFNTQFFAANAEIFLQLIKDVAPSNIPSFTKTFVENIFKP